MNARLDEALLILAVSLILASGDAGAADFRFGKAEMVARVSTTVSPRSQGPHRRVSQHQAAEDSAPLTYNSVALAEEDLDGRTNTVALYPIARGNEAGGGAPAAAHSPGNIAESAPTARKAGLPEPGSWAMLLAGLLGVGAIARRRMSA